MKLYYFTARRLYFLAWTSLIALIISQLFGRQFWQIELFSHFVPHYTLIILLSAVIFPPLKQHRRKIQSLFLLIGLGLAVWCVMPLFHQMPMIKADRITPITIGYQNVNVNNTHYQAVLDTISQHSRSELLILLEATPDWRQQVQKFNPNYQFICGNDEHSPFAIQIFSQKPVTCERLSLADFPMAKLTLQDGRTIFAVHPPPPLGSQLATARKAYLQQLHELVKQQKTSVMVIGDMNLSAFSPIYRDFIHDTRLHRKMENGVPTWLPLGISIDQILMKNEFADTESPYRLAWNGSDHRGFFVVW